MNKELLQVQEFHTTFDQPVLTTPTIPNIERCELRYKLIAEELEELKEAFLNNDIVEVADALSDLRYVLNGTYLEFGMAGISERLFDEVQRSNMSKACLTIEEAEATIQHYLQKDGTESEYKEKDGKYLVYRKSDNKVLKSINYSPADLKLILNSDKIANKWKNLGLLDGLRDHLNDDILKLYESQACIPIMSTEKSDFLITEYSDDSAQEVVSSKKRVMSDEEAEKEFPPFKVKKDENKD